MNWKSIRESPSFKLLGDLSLLHWVIVVLVPAAVWVVEAFNFRDQPIETKVPIGLLAIFAIYLVILSGLMRWEKRQQKLEKRLPMAQRTFAEARVGHRLWKWSKKNVKYAFGICFLVCFAVWGVSISKYPHLELSLPAPAIYTIDHVRELPQPNTSVVFQKLRIINNGSPSVTKNWLLTATVPADETLIGKPLDWKNAIFPLKVLNVLKSDLIFLKTANTPLARGALIEGGAVFYFLGVSNETLRAPGTKLVISCEDSTGRKVALQVKVPAQELILPPLSGQ